jgi:hypothetical protein
MKHTAFFSLLCCLLLAAVPSVLAQAQADKEAKIQSAMHAAPTSIITTATVVDWPSEPGGEMPVLREGDGEWTCITDNPATSEPDPMCMDRSGMEWVTAYLNQREPEITSIGTIYVLQGGAPMSNIDPFATGPTPDNEWMDPMVPHLGIVVPDAAALEGLSTNPDNGGTWVMFRDTPYVHMMVPLPRYETGEM